MPDSLREVDSIVQVNTECERLDSWFILVCPILRFRAPLRIRPSASSTAQAFAALRHESYVLQLLKASSTKEVK